MQPENQITSNPKVMVWTGRVISAFVVISMIASGVGKLMKPEPLLAEFNRLQWQESAIVGLAITEIVCALIYAFPQTSVLGAILLTGYLGGAIATHVRLPDTLDKTAGPIIGGVLVWLGLFLRDSRIRALIPFRK
jgi:uncharacterized membrane protein